MESAKSDTGYIEIDERYSMVAARVNWVGSRRTSQFAVAATNPKRWRKALRLNLRLHLN